jgi:DNA-binding NtrC family response regulator
LLTKYDWPGNIRELRNEIDRAVALSRASASITPEHLSAALRTPGGLDNGAPANPGEFSRLLRVAAAAIPAPPAGEDPKGPLRRARAAFEADFIAKALDRHQGNVSRAAIAMGLSRASLQKKMKEYGLR